ncbi:MAG: Rieske 2Fe-2S domain-containing protein [Chitinophagales bacterium]|nr:Rieske 2Fe-2S domain-containing protein [Chitinophagales bacterium]
MQWTALSDDVKTAFENLQLFQTAKYVFEGKSICVVKLEDGIFGINNRCPHAGAQLHYGHCNRKGIVSCPLHGYKFDIKTGNSADGNHYKLVRYKFKIENDILYIGVV